MDKRIRRNELCVIGLPRCDFVFSSTRTCFIGYGFQESALEMTILKHLLSDRGMEPVEAGGTLAPAQNAFCAKICSKIITSQFCIILINNDTHGDAEVPNANVNMEYGLMLGFNKYVIPFQRDAQRLPFNVAGLDTVKYTNENFETKAANAINEAIAATTQDIVQAITPDQMLEAFLLSQGLLVVPLFSQGDRDLFELGRHLAFNMLMTFDGMRYLYFGNFTALRPEIVVWRIKTLQEILAARFGSLDERVRLGLAATGSPELAALMKLKGTLQTWVLVTSESDRRAIETALVSAKLAWPVKAFAMPDIANALQNIT
jgi:Predicted nucleotide-binding protein containing TIR-like domain